MSCFYYIINLMRKHLLIIIIIVASLLTHFIFFGHPRETVFDEVHFGKFISGYFTHQYFFDIHPPLGKLLISGMGYITGFKPGFSFAEIGQKFPDQHYLWLRLLPTLAGILLPIIIYYLALELGMSGIAAFSAGMLVVLENALLVQSRFILLDAFLLLFGFSSLLFYFLFRNASKIKFLILTGITAGLTVSVKWTGLTFLATIVILYSIDCFKSSAKIKKIVNGAIFLVVVPLIIYFSIFAIHFSLLTKSGPGDAFMTPQFRKSLVGSQDNNDKNIKSLNIFQKFIELNKEMYTSNATLMAGHPYSSKWYTWPFMIRPVYYWYEANPSTDSGQVLASRIYFLGNPIIWWASTIAIFYLLLNILSDFYHNIKPKLLPALLAGVYLFNMLPFIGIKRAMFLYHYLIGLIFAIVALVYLIDNLENKKRIFAILLVVSFVSFIFFAPLSYGLPLSDRAYQIHNWLKSWM